MTNTFQKIFQGILTNWSGPYWPVYALSITGLFIIQCSLPKSTRKIWNALVLAAFLFLIAAQYSEMTTAPTSIVDYR